MNTNIFICDTEIDAIPLLYILSTFSPDFRSASFNRLRIETKQTKKTCFSFSVSRYFQVYLAPTAKKNLGEKTILFDTGKRLLKGDYFIASLFIRSFISISFIYILKSPRKRWRVIFSYKFCPKVYFPKVTFLKKFCSKSLFFEITFIVRFCQKKCFSCPKLGK